MPDWQPYIRSRLAPLHLSPERELEIADELSQHLDEVYEEQLAAGADAGDARRAVIAELIRPGLLDTLGHPHARPRDTRPAPLGQRGGSFLANVLVDLRYGFRTLRGQPAIALAAILTLALGIGANSAIFALVDATLLRPLPFHEADRLVLVWERTDTTPRGLTPVANLDEWSRRNRTFAQLAGVSPNTGSMVLAHSDGTTDVIARQWATAGFFEVLGVHPVAGRLFTVDDASGGRDLVVLGEGLWRTRFNADPDVVGQTFRLDGLPFTVVGIAPADFRFIGEPEMWALDRRGGMTLVIGRMNADVSIDAAAADMTAVAATLASELPETNQGRTTFIQPLHDAAVDGDLRLTSWLLVAVVAFVLLMCCANVANLLLARGAGRTRELAVRSALGADRLRIVQQLLTESGVLSIAGGLAGAGVGALILALAPRVIPPGLLPAPVTLAFDVRVFVFCALVAIATGLLFGMAPAWQATRVSPAQATGNSRTIAGGDGRLRGVLMAAQVAAAVVLLFGAGLLARTLVAVYGVDRGYRAGEVLTMVVDPPESHYPTAEALERFYSEVSNAVSALPFVENVAWATTLPLGRSYAGQTSFTVADEPLPDDDRLPTADNQTVSAGYFRTIDLPIVAGRAFNESDARTSGAVCIINEALARRFFADRSPVGAHLQIGSTTREIVGVARQVKRQPDEADDLLQIYTPLTQSAPGDVFVLVRPTSGSAEALAGAVRGAIGRIDTAQVVSVRDTKSLDDVVSEATVRHRFRAVVAGMFAIVAAGLAATGLFGLVAYSTQQRIRDFGIRRALGATTADIVRIVAGGALRVVIGGTVIGLIVAAGLTRTIGSLLFGVEPLDPATFGFVLVSLVAVVASATAIPALRAVRVDPAVSLRGD